MNCSTKWKVYKSILEGLQVKGYNFTKIFVERALLVAFYTVLSFHRDSVPNSELKKKRK